MNLYVMRHGFTKMNKEHKFNGQTDDDLIDEGVKQAEEAREIIKNMDFDVIYCSPLLRAKHTCKIVNANNIPVIYDDRLMERTMGELDGKDVISMEDFYDYFFKLDIPEFETYADLFERVHSFIDELKGKDYKNVLIIAHGGVLRSIFYYFNEIPKDGNLLAKYKSSKNCQLDKYEL